MVFYVYKRMTMTFSNIWRLVDDVGQPDVSSISCGIRVVRQPFKNDDVRRSKNCELDTPMPTTVVLTSVFSVRANSFRTIRLVTERPVLSKHALHGTHSKKSVASGRSGICISVVRSFTTRMKAAQHQVARNIRNCKRYYR